MWATPLVGSQVNQLRDELGGEEKAASLRIAALESESAELRSALKKAKQDAKVRRENSGKHQLEAT